MFYPTLCKQSGVSSEVRSHLMLPPVGVPDPRRADSRTRPLLYHGRRLPSQE
ncbi:MAG: hypothetical protein AAFY78_01095 [Cyanobacteria bacterium J06648_16]